MADRLFRGWMRQQGVVDQDTGDKDAYEQPRTVDNKLKAPSGIILGVLLGFLVWALIGLAIWR